MHANWEQLVSAATRWVIAPSCVFHFLFVLLLSFLQIGCRFWDLALREHAQYNKVVGHSLQCPFSLLVLLLPPPPPFLPPHDISPLLRLVFMMNQSAASSEMLTRGSQSVMQQCTLRTSVVISVVASASQVCQPCRHPFGRG